MSDINAVVRMEEKYLKMELEYHNNDDKHKIFKTINDVDAVHKFHPDIYIRVVNENNGHYTVEFSTEHDNREAGEFFEDILKILNIKACN